MEQRLAGNDGGEGRDQLIYVYGVRKGPVSFFCMRLSNFPMPHVDETVLSPLHTLASFVVS